MEVLPSNDRGCGYVQFLEQFLLQEEQGNVAGVEVVTNCDGFLGEDQQSDEHGHEELGLRSLRSLVSRCCEAICANSTTRAYNYVNELRDRASLTGTPNERLAHYFAEALVARITGTGSLIYKSLSTKQTLEEVLRIFALTAEKFPGFGLPIFFTNQIILDEISSASRVHVIDFGIGPGYRWLCLIKDFSERAGGPPHFRITAVDRPSILFFPSEVVKAKLTNYARKLGVPFEFHSVVASDWDMIQASELQSREDEVLVVASFNRLREVCTIPRRKLLRNIYELRPRLFFNAAFPPVSVDLPSLAVRVRVAFDYYSGMFEAIEAALPSGDLVHAEERRFIERLRGLELFNAVACDGEDLERPENYKQWQVLMEEAGFEAYDIKRHVYAGAKTMLATYQNASGYSVGRSGNWLLVRRNRQLFIAMSNWTTSTQV